MKPLVSALAILAATSASAAPAVTVEPISSVSVGGPGKVAGDFCTAPMLSEPVANGSAVLLIHVTPDGRIGDVVPEPGTQHTKHLGELVQAAKSMCLTPATGKPRVIKAVYFLGSGQ